MLCRGGTGSRADYQKPPEILGVVLILSTSRWFGDTETCPHCAPHQSAHYLFTKYIVRASSFLFPFPDAIPKYRFGRSRRVWELCANWCADVLTNILLFLGIAKADPVANFKSILKPHTLLIAHECARRGLPLFIISVFARPTPRFFIAAHDKRVFFDELPIPQAGEKHPFVDKAYVREVLLEHNIPVARGATLKSFKQAFELLDKEYSFPLVVKPRYGSLSRHNTLAIQSIDELQRAIAIAQEIESNFIVEEQVPGNVCRAILISQKLIACARREARHLIGDGIHTIEELAKTSEISFTLSACNVSPKTVLAKGEKIYIEEKMTAAHKPLIHDVTDNVHADVRSLLERISVIFSTKLIGIDFVAEDVTLPPAKQFFAVLELNSMPHIALHDNPATGQSRDIAGPLLDTFLA